MLKFASKSSMKSTLLVALLLLGCLFGAQAASHREGQGLWSVVLASSHWGSLHKHVGVQAQINKFHRAGDLQQRVRNASPYLAYVYQQAKKMGVPTKFVLLPLMESNYNPKAARGHATGLWQLEHGTAKYMHILMNTRYDGREDIVVSTHAALQHLRDNYTRFHNWELAIAAYNCGTRPVTNAIARNKRLGRATDYWAIRSQLPKITQQYIPRLIALNYMLNHAKHYGISLPNLSVIPKIRTVTVKQKLSFKQIHQLSGASVRKLKQLNPGLLRGATLSHRSYQLMLPSSAVSEFQRNLASMNKLFVHKATVTHSKKKVVHLAAKKQSGSDLKSLLSKIYGD
jgi:membrane-bound lytic murein transglycosylase D